MTEEKFDIDSLNQLLENKEFEKIQVLLSEADPADAADILEELESDDREWIFSILDNEMASEVLSEMEPNEAEEIVEHLTPDKIAEMVREMAPDDAADLFNDLEDDEKEDVLKHLNDEEKLKLKALTVYEEDSAGGLMTSELCSVSASASVQEAINLIASTDFSDPISLVFAVDDQQRLLGAIHIPELLAKPKNAKISEFIEEYPACAIVNEDQETIANNFRKYDLYVMPVVDENNKLMGRITVDDVMDVMHEETNEDVAHMAGAPDIEQGEDMPWKIARLRLPWLMITMFTGVVISIIIRKMTGITKVEGLAAFVPVIMAMGGNTGMQASAVTVRSIALGEIEFGKLIKVFIREIIVGIMMGIICGLIAGFAVWFNLKYMGGALTHPPLQLAFVVSVSMCCAMTFAALAGTMLPIFLHQMDIDPALASGPFVTTGNDLAASLIYFLMCYMLLTEL